MGVEYTHFFIVKDPKWVGTFEHARRVHAVLEGRGLVAGPPAIYDLSEGNIREIGKGIDASIPIPANFHICYPEVQGVPGIAEVIGPNWGGAPDEEQYLERISFIAGTDFRVHPSDERIYVNADGDPSWQDRLSEGRDQLRIRFLHSSMFEGIFFAAADADPPEAEVQAEVELPDGFAGVWRAALVFECNKNVPEFAAEERGGVPCDEFVRELEEALGTEVVQVGLVH